MTRSARHWSRRWRTPAVERWTGQWEKKLDTTTALIEMGGGHSRISQSRWKESVGGTVHRRCVANLSSRRSSMTMGGFSSSRALEAKARRDVPCLIEILFGTDPAGRRAAVHSLGDLRDPAAIPALRRCLQASDEMLRQGGIRGLEMIGDPEAIPDLLDVAETDRSFGVRMRAASALCALGERRGVTLIGGMLNEPGCPWPRWYKKWASKRLVEVHGTEALPALEEACRSGDVLSRWRLRRAGRMLRAMGGPSRRH